MAKKKAGPQNNKRFEESLWDSANRLRGSVESSEYKHVVLSLIFLKFVSDKFEERRADLIAEGQEKYTATTYKLAKMNLAVRGISANLGEAPADTFFKDQHPDLKADYIMTNTPFNMKKWRADNELTDDSRWDGYETPPVGNANYAWILHMVSKLSDRGMAGFVLANGSMSTNTKGEGLIRQKMVENDLVDCMVALPGQLFYTTQIPVCLWFLTKSKKTDSEREFRNREGETLFIDARKIGEMISRKQKELTHEDIEDIARTYHSWRYDPGSTGVSPANAGGTPALPGYEDQAGYCKSATLEEIRKNDYVLTPGRYVGAPPLEDDGIPFETKMTEMSQTLSYRWKNRQSWMR